MGLSAVQANTMTVEYALGGGDDMPDRGECAGCGEGVASPSACYSVCATSIFSMPVSTASLSGVGSSISFIPDNRRLRSINLIPDPHPPKPTLSI